MTNLHAGKLMELYMECGKYGMMKESEKEIKGFKEKIHENFKASDEKRKEYKEFDTVVKYVKKPIYEIDYEGLNEYLADKGILPMVVKTMQKEALKNHEQLLELFVLPQEYTLGVSINKKGKELIPESKEIPTLEDWQYISLYSRMKPNHEKMQKLYEKLKKRMIDCPVLNAETKIKHTYGSVYLKKLQPQYDIGMIMEELGDEFIIKNGKPNMALLDDFVTRGTILPNEINQFKKVLDYRFDIVIMSLESEHQIMSMLNQKRINASLNAGL